MKLSNKNIPFLSFVSRKIGKIFAKNRVEFSLRNFTSSYEVGKKECVILGNGPSLKETFSSPQQYEFIKNRVKFCVNDFANHDEFFALKPEFLVFMDPFYWSKNLVEPFLSDFRKTYENLLKADWNITIFMPKEAQKWNFFCEISKQNINIIYINTRSNCCKKEEQKFAQYVANKSMPHVQNVLVAAIYLAINIGFSKTYIFGADHSWHQNLFVNDDNVVCIKDTHFYDQKEVKSRPAFKEASCRETFKMHELFSAFAKKYQSYVELENYSKFMGKKVYNASKVSFIDAFERIKI